MYVEHNMLMRHFAATMKSRMGALVSTPLGVPWFRAHDYARCREMMDDRDKLPATFSAWEREAQDRLEGLLDFSCSLEKVEIDPERFAAFCQAQGLRPSAMARNAYAAFVLAQRTF